MLPPMFPVWICVIVLLVPLSGTESVKQSVNVPGTILQSDHHSLLYLWGDCPCRAGAGLLHRSTFK